MYGALFVKTYQRTGSWFDPHRIQGLAFNDDRLYDQFTARLLNYRNPDPEIQKGLTTLATSNGSKSCVATGLV